MVYPFLEITGGPAFSHSELLEGDRVAVYATQCLNGKVCSGTCYLPGYVWEDVVGFSDAELVQVQEYIRMFAHLFFQYARCGGFENA